VSSREKKGRLEARHILDIENLVDAVDGVLYSRWSTLHRNLPPPQLEYTSYHSWVGLSIGRRYSTPFAASTSTSLSKYIQPAQAEDGMGPASIYTGSLVSSLKCTVSSVDSVLEYRLYNVQCAEVHTVG
jgi:hypothetical protein